MNDIPAPSGFREWMQSMYVKVTASSKRSKRRTLKWLQAVESCNDVALMEAPGRRWDDLDTALAETIVEVAKGPHQARVAIVPGRTHTSRRALGGQSSALDGVPEGSMGT